MPKRNLNEKMAFDKWFVMNYSRLKEKIGLVSIFDADAFHDTYLTLATSKDLPSVAEDYSKIFLTTYRKVSRRALNECYTICHPDELFFTLLPDIEEEKEEKDLTSLVKNIGKFILNTFTSTQQTVFQMRLQGFSIRDTADSLNLNDRQVRENMDDVICRTRKQFAFAI